MGGTVNKVILIGSLGKDPEIVTGQNGKFATLSIATSESWRDKSSGERKEVTDWHNIVIFDKVSAEFAEKYLKKGNKVYVEGKQKTRKWEKDGVTHYVTETVVAAFDGQIQNLTKREGEGRGVPSEDDYGTPSTRSSSGTAGTPEDNIDDIPF